MPAENSSLFKISEVSKFLNIPPATLRYYEEYGLIKPSIVDESSLYRYYKVTDVNRICSIMEMRKAGLSLKQIKACINNKILPYEQLKQLKKQREHLDNVIAKIEIFNTPKEKYDILKVTMPPCYCKNIKVLAKDIYELYSYHNNFIAECMKTCHIDQIMSYTFIEYDSLIPVFENINAIIYCPVNEKNSVVFPAIKGIRTFHRGSLDNIGKAYEALFSYAKENNLQLNGNALEFYRNLFDFTANSDYILTEIILPIIDT